MCVCVCVKRNVHRIARHKGTDGVNTIKCALIFFIRSIKRLLASFNILIYYYTFFFRFLN